MKNTDSDIKPEPFSPREWAFINEYLKTGHATQSAITAGYSPKSAHVQANRMLRNDKIKAEIARRQRELAQLADYDIHDALQEYDLIFTKALAAKKFRIALHAVDAKVKLYGLSLEGEPQNGTGSVVNNNSLYISDAEWMEFWRRKEAAGHGIDVGAIGHDIALCSDNQTTHDQNKITPIMTKQ